MTVIPHPLPPLVYLPTPNRSYRLGARVNGIVIHETEGGFAGAVSWLRNPIADASAHAVLREDGMLLAQLVPWSGMRSNAWHAANANRYTIGLELAGFTANPNKPEQLARAARIVGWWCHTYGVPTHQGDRYGHNGIVRHRDLGAYGGGHHDPGGFDWSAFLAAVAAEVRRGGFRQDYGVR